MTCPECGGAVVDNVSYCQHCGASLAVHARPQVCAQCGTRNPGDTNYCHSCGARMEAVVPTSVVSSAQLAGGAVRAGADAAGRARFVTVRRDGSDGDAFPIAPGQSDIGRSEGELRFDDPHLAARHARIVNRGGEVVLTPLEARNGVYVRLRDACELDDGWQFLLGKQVLRFELLSDAERAVHPAVEHGVVLFGTPVKPPWGRLRQLTAAGTSRDLFHLTRSETTLGREHGDIVFSDDEFLSRRHAQLQFRGGRVTLLDLGSSNGTYVRLRGPHPLGHGEMLRLGDELLRFELG
jgi:pSer/pThr/pTyr-binding forkhead associated (FHA) protein/ribosomal protein L40E